MIKTIKEPTPSEDDPFIMDFVLDKTIFDESNGKIIYYSLILTKFLLPAEFDKWDGKFTTSYAITEPFWNPFQGNL